MKKYIAALCIVLVIVLGGCVDTYDAVKQYPWYKADTWYCEGVNMTIQFTYDENGEYDKVDVSPLIWNDETYAVDVFFQAGAVVFPSDVNGDGLKEGIITGTWYYDGGKLVIRIDNSLLDMFCSELVFVPRESE